MRITWSDIRREPFRLLFPLGALFGVVGVGHWLLYATHVSTSSSSFFHASMQVGVFMFCFISGFLLTALPRFSATARASNAELILIAGFLLAQVSFLLLGRTLTAQFCFIGLLGSLIVFAGKRFAKKKGELLAPPSFVWIPLALLHGMAGSALMIANELNRLPNWAIALGRPMMQQGFLLGIVLGVGGFLAPRLMGRTEIFKKPGGADAAVVALRQNKRKAFVHQMTAGAFFLTFVLEGLGWVRAAYLLRALLVTGNLLWSTHFHRRPAVCDTYVLLVWYSLWALCLGLWGAGLWPQWRVGMLHITFIGGFSLMIFAVATMVVLSHGGQAHQLQKPLAILRMVGTGVVTAMVFRLAAELMPAQYFKLLGAASFVWVIVSVSWLLFALPRVTQAVPEDEFERLHESAKQRLRVAPPAA